MSSIRHPRPSANGHPEPPVSRTHGTPVLADADRRQLLRHLAWCEAAERDASPYLGHVLRHRIAASSPCGMEPPADAVAGGCRVAYSIGDGPARTGLLAHNARDAATGIGVIPVLSLLGATLIGLRVGQTVPMLCEDGTVTRLTVLGVARPA